MQTEMKQTTWPCRSDGHRFTAFPFRNSDNGNHQIHRTKYTNRESTGRARRTLFSSSSSSTDGRDFAALLPELIVQMAASLSSPDLRAASLVCKAWGEALRQLRKAMTYLSWGKRFKHGRGVVRDVDLALDAFLKGARFGSALAMVDAGLIYWERGLKDKAMALYRQAAELGDLAGKCNLGISYLQVEPPNPKEAVKWLHCASLEGHTRAQYQLALCLHQGRGVCRNIKEAAKWYLKAAEGGYVRAMYNVSLCYSSPEGVPHSRTLAKKWMKRAADRGHLKAQYQHGLTLFSEGDMMRALVYLELATRSGETAAAHVRDVALQELSESSRQRALVLINKWNSLPPYS